MQRQSHSTLVAAHTLTTAFLLFDSRLFVAFFASSALLQFNPVSMLLGLLTDGAEELEHVDGKYLNESCLERNSTKWGKYPVLQYCMHRHCTSVTNHIIVRFVSYLDASNFISPPSLLTPPF